jgi:hypothetical protein
MKTNQVSPKIKSTGTAFRPKKPERDIDSEHILRLLQNSRRVAPPPPVARRESSILFSLARAIGKVVGAWIPRRSRKKNLYERLADTVDGIANDPPRLYEKLAAGKGSHRKRSQDDATDRQSPKKKSSSR